MNESRSAERRSPETPPQAYLVLRLNGSWEKIYRLEPGQVTTLGRSPGNRIVLNDAMCSRNHCEVFHQGRRWVLRDLESRNGTLVDEEPIDSEWPLSVGEQLRIGAATYYFVEDLEQLSSINLRENVSDDTEAEREAFDTGGITEQLEVLHSQSQTRYAERSASTHSEATSRELARLYKLALEMGQAQTVSDLAGVVLDGLIGATSANIGAVLLFPDPEYPDPADLRLTSYRSKGDVTYRKISRQLTEKVLESREAMLAMDTASDERLVVRDSLGEIQAESVICAPIRHRHRLLGLIHLYATDPGLRLDESDLNFTHAVADQLASSVHTLTENEILKLGLERATNENTTLREELGVATKIIGESSSIRKLNSTIATIAPTSATVLIRGESGAGKELVARSIHEQSRRAEGPFVTMNCAALSETLLESELFGHEKGSFTGATDRKFGKFEQADGGTLFLDEAGEMGASIQAKFLRVLEGHPFERVGGREQVRVDVRVVAATNRDLEKMVEEGKFRADLYFRLNVVQIYIDPLRKRKSDIPILAAFFLKKFAQKLGRRTTAFRQDALDMLMEYDWPGNVRELQNTIERTVILCQNEFVSRRELQFSPVVRQPDSVPEMDAAAPIATTPGYREISIKDLEREHILATLEHTEWNKSKAAQILGIERSTLDRKLTRYQVSRPN